MNLFEAKAILDDLHKRYPQLKKMSAVETAAFVRTLPPDEQKPIEAASKAFEIEVRQAIDILTNKARFN